MVGAKSLPEYNADVNATDLKTLLERVQAWPEVAQDELVAVANEIESELQGQDYFATREELQIIDAAIAAIDAGQVATEADVEAAFQRVLAFGK